MEKVKYNRTEYREEYLRSDEWKNLRMIVLNAECDCQCCKAKKASDVHHMVYRNLVDIKITDLIPVCRNCHEYIHQAISDGYISQNPKYITEIVSKTLNILADEKYKGYRKWLDSKHHLSETEIKKIKNLQAFIIKKICGMLRRAVWYDDLPNLKFTGRQVEKIREIIILAEHRRRRKVDKAYGNRMGFVMANHNDDRDKYRSLKTMPKFKSRKSIKSD